MGGNTNHFLESKDLLSLLAQIDLGGADLPAFSVGLDAEAERTADDLMAEAYPDGGEVVCRGGIVDVLVDEFHEIVDPTRVFARGRLRSGEKNAVDLIARGILDPFVSDVVFWEQEQLGQGYTRPEHVATPSE